jgi:hypothetical protein
MDTPQVEQPIVETPIEETKPEPIAQAETLTQHREMFPDAGKKTGMVSQPAPAPEAEKPRGQRNRARSQDASPDEVRQISALGKEARDAEESVSEVLGLKPNDGESPRLFELRRRKAIAQAVKDLKAAPAPAAPVTRETPRSASPVVTSTAPAEPDASDATKYPYGTSDPKYQQDLIDFAVEKKFRAQSVAAQQEAAEAEAAAGKKRFAERWTAAEKEIPGFRDIASKEVPWSKGDPIDLWIWDRPYGPKLLWYLNHPDHLAETREIMALSVTDQLERLSLLGQRFSSNNGSAGGNGSTGALHPPVVVTPSPRPPTPVKTGPMRSSGDTPDTSKGPLSAHRALYHQPGRRR